MDAAILKAINLARAERRGIILVKDLMAGTSSLINAVSDAPDDLKDAVDEAFRTGKSRLVSIEGQDIFIDAFVPAARLVVIGAVHITQHLAVIAASAGYEIEVIDPRTAFATPERFGGLKLTADWPENVLKNSPLDQYCALIALTHDPKIDDFALRNGLEAGCFYVGALGSRKTHAKRVTRLREAGVNAQMLEKIHAPIGLDIRAANPAEIAVAIMAQVIDSFRRRGA